MQIISLPIQTCSEHVMMLFFPLGCIALFSSLLQTISETILSHLRLAAVFWELKFRGLKVAKAGHSCFIPFIPNDFTFILTFILLKAYIAFLTKFKNNFFIS